MKKKVSIVLVNYNTTQDTIECIKSLEKIDYNNFDIIVVDNKSRQDEFYELDKFIKNIKNCILISSDKNGGFAYGNNIGIKLAKKRKSDYILLLNSDTEVEKDFLNYLVATIEEDVKSIAIAIGKINYYYDKKKIWYGGGIINWRNYTGVHFGENQSDNGQCDIKKEITFATGCAMLINANINTDITLPEEYFMYYEDVDFCARLVNEGFKIIYEPKAVIYHKVGVAGGGEMSPFTLRWSNRGRIIFMNKYKNQTTKLNMIIIKNKFYITRFIKSIVLICKKENKKAIELIRGTLDGIKISI